MNFQIEVFIPYFNHENFIHDTLKSIIFSNLSELEVSIKIRNDGSDFEILQQKLKNIKLPKNIKLLVEDEKNVGAFHAIKEELHQTESDFLFILNSDDKFHPNRIIRFVNAMQDLPYAWGFSAVNILKNFEDRDLDSYYWYLKKLSLEKKSFPARSEFDRHNYGITTGNLVFKNPNYYSKLIPNIRFDLIHDWLIFKSLNIFERPVYLSEDLYLYNLHGKNTILQDRVFGAVEGPLLEYWEQQIISVLNVLNLDSIKN